MQMARVTEELILTPFSTLAVQSMIQEVELTPKPGLVDRLDAGAHNDMTLEHFYKSAGVLEPWFNEIIEATPIDGPSSDVLKKIRPTGICAEKAMFKATGGINTHKGQIFSLGVCLAAAHRVMSQPQHSNMNKTSGIEILLEAGRICRGISDEMNHNHPPSSHGEKIFRTGGYKGIRGEAETGFPSVRITALPRLQELLKSGYTLEEASLETLILLYSFVEDSNVLYRCGTGGLNMLRNLSNSFLREGGIRQKGALIRLEEMNYICIGMNISPGGCADLLALTLFIHQIEESFEL